MQGHHQACAVCKHQRKRCKENCVLAPFFPSDKSKQFEAVHQIFGVSNVSKIVNKLKTYEERVTAVETLVWEAELRLSDPMFGSYGQYRKVLEELKMYRRREAATTVAAIETPAAALMYEPNASLMGWSNNINNNISSINNNNNNNNNNNVGNYMDHSVNIHGGFHPLMAVSAPPYVFSTTTASSHVQGHDQQQINGTRGRDIVSTVNPAANRLQSSMINAYSSHHCYSAIADQ